MSNKSLFKRRLLTSGSLIALSTLLVLLTLSVALDHKAAHAAPSATSVPVLYEVRLSQNERSIWQYTGTPLTGWQEIGAPNTQTASVVATTSHVYQLQLNGDILVYTGTSTNWTALDATGNAQEIALSSTGQLYKEEQDGSAWMYAGGTNWTQLSSSANSAPLGSLTAGPNGALYSIGQEGVWKYTGTPITGWQEIDNSLANGFADAVSLVATPNGKLYELRFNAQTSTSAVWAYNGTPLSWKQIGTQAGLVITGDGKNHLYQDVSGGTLWRYSGSGTTWTALKNPSPAQTGNITASAAGQVFEILTTGAVWMLNSGKWTQVDNSTTSFWIASSEGGNGINSVG